MDALLIEPNKAPHIIELDGSLKSLQNAVGGYIEAIYPYEDPVALICNEEGKLNGLPLNRRLEDYDIIAGPFLICGIDEADFITLPPDMVQKYTEKFQDPESFFKVGNRILAVPFKLGEDGEPLQPKSKPKFLGPEL